MALDADTRQGRLGIQVQPLPERRAAASHRLGVAGRRSGDRQHLRARAAARRSSRSAATASCCGTARSARSSPRSRRTAAARCRRSSTATWSSSAPRSRTGARAAARAHRFIALDKRTGDVVYVANPGGRPYDTAYAAPIIATINGMRLLIAGLGDGGDPRDQAADRREGLELRRRQARHQHRRRRQRQHRVRLARRREPRRQRARPDRRDRRLADRRHQDDEVGGARGSSSATRRRSLDGTRLYQIDNGSTLRAFDIDDRQGAVDAAARHGAEGAAGAGRRQDLRRHRRRQVLHRPAARRSRARS